MTQAYWASRYMGSLRLTMDPIKRKLLSITGTPILLGGYASANPVVPDPKVAAMIAEMAGPITAYSNQVIGAQLLRTCIICNLSCLTCACPFVLRYHCPCNVRPGLPLPCVCASARLPWHTPASSM